MTLVSGLALQLPYEQHKTAGHAASPCWAPRTAAQVLDCTCAPAACAVCGLQAAATYTPVQS